MPEIGFFVRFQPQNIVMVQLTQRPVEQGVIVRFYGRFRIFAGAVPAAVFALVSPYSKKPSARSPMIGILYLSMKYCGSIL